MFQIIASFFWLQNLDYFVIYLIFKFKIDTRVPFEVKIFYKEEPHSALNKDEIWHGNFIIR